MKLEDLNIIVSCPYWTLGGVNTFSENLVRELQQQDLRARILLTEEHTQLLNILEPAQPYPTDILLDELPVHKLTTWGGHWGALIRYLEDLSPCIYIPNGDWRHSIVSTRLPEQVGIVGVAHADEPIHYDHVNRLGKYWNHIVTVNSIIADNIIKTHPDFRDNVSTISIGVTVPGQLPARNHASGQPLSLIYSGRIQEYQKRISDVLSIMEELDRRNVNARLTVIGSGDDQQAFLDRARPLIDKGRIDFKGKVPFSEVPGILAQHDVFLLTSQFEGLPNALLEAMAQGCIPVSTDIPGDIQKVIQHGANGYRLPIGDAQGFADILEQLASHQERCAALSQKAFETIRTEGYRVKDMADSYRAVFERVADTLGQKRHFRLSDEMPTPPNKVGELSILPLEYPVHEPGIGRFNTVLDAAEFKDALQGQVRTSPIFDETAPVPARIVFSLPNWLERAETLFAQELGSALCGRGWEVDILLTDVQGHPGIPGEDLLPRDGPYQVYELKTRRHDTLSAKQQDLYAFLESRQPCIYIPGNDWTPADQQHALSEGVRVLGVVHEATPHTQAWLEACANELDAVVTRSVEAELTFGPLGSGLCPQTVFIPSGLPLPTRKPHRADDPATLGLYIPVGTGPAEDTAGSILALCTDLERTHIPYRLTLEIAHNPDLWELLNDTLLKGRAVRSSTYPADHRIKALSEHDVYLPLDADAPWSEPRMREALGCGCVPLVGTSQSAFQHLVRNGFNGLQVQNDSPAAWAEKLADLHHNPALRKELSRHATEAVQRAAFTLQEMTDDFIALFSRMLTGIPRAEPSPDQPAAASAAPPKERDHKSFEALRTMPIIFSCANWVPDDVNLLSLELARELNQQGFDARILLTEDHSRLVDIPGPRMPHPTDVPFELLAFDDHDTWGGHWGAVVRYLENLGPCIYVPNYDYRHACAVPILPDEVYVAGTVFGNDPLHKDHVERLGAFWDRALVFHDEVPPFMKDHQELLSRTHLLAFAIPTAAGHPLHINSDPGCMHIGIPAGIEPPPGLRDANLVTAIPPFETGKEVPLDAIAWQGPDTMLLRRYMAQGCVPLLLDAVADRDRFLTRHGWNALSCQDRNAQRNAVTLFTEQPARWALLAKNAHAYIQRSTYTIPELTEDLLLIFSEMLHARASGTYQRPRGTIVPPPPDVNGVTILPVTFRFKSKSYGPFIDKGELKDFLATSGRRR